MKFNVVHQITAYIDTEIITTFVYKIVLHVLNDCVYCVAEVIVQTGYCLFELVLCLILKFQLANS